MQRMVVALGGALAAVLLTAGSVFAAPNTYTDNVAGVEIAATATQGTFVGTASGGLPGSWEAVVDHAGLPTTVGASTGISGGSFDFTPYRGPRIDGTFNSGGTITMTSAGADCTNQTYAVGDGLTLARGGTGSFAVTLTHYRTVLFGQCVTYGASVQGTLTLSF